MTQRQTQSDASVLRRIEKFVSTKSHDYSTEEDELVAKADECVQVNMFYFLLYPKGFSVFFFRILKTWSQ